jgi:hypothetical protein
MDSHDLALFRRDLDDIPIDEYEPLQDIALFFNEAEFSSNAWPSFFDHYIQTDPYQGDPESSPHRSTRSSPRSSASPCTPPHKYPLKTFYGTCTSEITSYFGRIHGLPPQQGIPGFQRMSCLRFSRSSDPNQSHDPEKIWGYEGCILPGGRIIVGRWWIIKLHEEPEPIDRYSGPFVWWNIDEGAADPPLDPTDTLELLKALKQRGYL